jgi:hypothetical protein
MNAAAIIAYYYYMMMASAVSLRTVRCLKINQAVQATTHF